jgi:hypothetical protein
MLSVAAQAYRVSPLVADDLPWPVRVRLRSARKKGRTGLLLYGIIRTWPRAMTRETPLVWITEGKRRLGICSPTRHLPKWVALVPGAHDLSFFASRTVAFSSFDDRVTLSEGDVLVAVCEPVQPNTFYARSPDADLWNLGIIDSKGHARPVRPAQP